MRLKSALKKKGQIIKECNFFEQKLQRYNCVPVENAQSRAYDPRESLSSWLEKVDELIELKVNIQKANTPMFKKIIRMAELKGVVKSLSHLPCHSGLITDEDYRKVINYDSAIPVKERDELVKKLEQEIATLQEELDEFNLTTYLVL